MQLARRLAPPEDVWLYDRMLDMTDTLTRYFRAMEDHVDCMELELTQLSITIHMMLEDIRF